MLEIEREAKELMVLSSIGARARKLASRVEEEEEEEGNTIVGTSGRETRA